MTAALPLTIVLPTYRREQVLVDTLRFLMGLPEPAAEMIVVDQTRVHDEETDVFLRQQESAGRLRLVRLALPSVTAAMNAGLRHARQELVLFLDDDLRPEPGLVRAHWDAHRAHPGVIVAGRVLQPWDECSSSARPGSFTFANATERFIDEFMGGNFSISRVEALRMGGFDENFVRVAYRFESEFAHRWRIGGGRIFFAPHACIHHLKAQGGGTRSFGQHQTTWRPDHAVGAYYWALRTASWREFFVRPVRAVTTRFHLRHPWRIPPTLVAELGGMLWALKLHLAGPKRMAPESDAR
jgi:GT2 family glycosyltransferase